MSCLQCRGYIGSEDSARTFSLRFPRSSRRCGNGTAEASPVTRRSSLWIFLCCIVLLLAVVKCEVTESNSAKKVAVSEVVLDAPVESLKWAGKDSNHIFCISMTGKVYRSLDAGKNWTPYSESLAKLIPTTNPVVASAIHVHPTHPNFLVILGRHNRSFVSRDGGLSFDALKLPSTIASWIFHPSRPEWAIFSRWSEGCTSLGKPDGKSRDPCRLQLYMTKNLGSTSSWISDYIVQFSWGSPKPASTRRKVVSNEDYIFFTRFDIPESKRSHQPKASGWTLQVSFYQTTGASEPRLLVPGGNKFLVSNGYIFVAMPTNIATQEVSLLVSTDGGNTFNEAKLPEPLHQKSYTILDTHGDAVIIHVNHGIANSETFVGNIYISDASGLRFSLSLERNVRTREGECEFDMVSSLPGVYIANFLADARRESTSETGEDTPIDGSPDSALNSLDASPDWDIVKDSQWRQRRGKDESLIRTVITFDKGGTWSYLNPPRVDSRGKIVKCSDQDSNAGSGGNETSASDSRLVNYADLRSMDEPASNLCKLHLHGISHFHQFAPFYSVESAVGLVMGTGNVGSSLSFNRDEINTYISRDGGLTWNEAHKGAYIYEFGDHGGLVVMADDLAKTNKVVFSWNEGQSWYDFNLGNDTVDVHNIVMEPNGTSVEFLLYGTRGSAGVVFNLNFATLGQPPCKGLWAADSVSSDYETWQPADGRTGSNCLLGRSTTFTRRKQTSECFNGQEFSRVIESKNCVCAELDYECEYGFKRNLGSLKCVPQELSLTQEGCTSSSIFYADAYRKIPSDTCEGGWVPPKSPVVCPDTSPFSRRARVLLLSVVGLALVLVVLTCNSNDPRLRGLTPSKGASSLSNAKYAVLNATTRVIDTIEAYTSTTHTIRDPATTGYAQTGGVKDRPAFDEDIVDAESPKPFSSEMQFIETQQRDAMQLCKEEEEEDAPPLLEFPANNSMLMSLAADDGSPPASSSTLPFSAATELSSRLFARNDHDRSPNLLDHPPALVESNPLFADSSTQGLFVDGEVSTVHDNAVKASNYFQSLQL